MPLKIVGAGFGRTGTMSTYRALKQLGFPCYHMLEVMQNKANKSHVGFWLNVARMPAGTQHDWEEVFGAYTAALDNPACCVWRELVAAYPDAKVLLTLHPKGAEAWYDSTMETIYFSEKMWQFAALKFAVPFVRKFGEMSHKLIWQRAHQGTMDDRVKAIAHYNKHIEDVKAAIPPDRLLIFSADQGWEPLCRFLGAPVPVEAFPKVNERASMRKAIILMIVAAYIVMALAALAAGAMIYGAYRLFS